MFLFYFNSVLSICLLMVGRGGCPQEGFNPDPIYMNFGLQKAPTLLISNSPFSFHCHLRLLFIICVCSDFYHPSERGKEICIILIKLPSHKLIITRISYYTVPVLLHQIIITSIPRTNYSFRVKKEDQINCCKFPPSSLHSPFPSAVIYPTQLVSLYISRNIVVIKAIK